MTTEKTFEELADDEIGTVYVDRFDDGARFVILRGPSALCAYLGVPQSHPLAGLSYNDVPVECHGGLTYAGNGVKGTEADNFYWYGWDYAHSGDRSFYELQYPEMPRLGEQEWTPSTVERDSWTAQYEFKALMRLAEAIARKGHHD